MNFLLDLVWSPPELYPTRHIFASHLKRFTLAKFGLETKPTPDPGSTISRPFTVNFAKVGEYLSQDTSESDISNKFHKKPTIYI